MSNPLANALGGANNRQDQSAQEKAKQAMSQLQADPSGVLGQLGLNVPPEMNNPQQIVQHLMQTGQLPQSRFNQIIQMMGQMMAR